jgi:DnaJ-class molecular chaperone
MATQTCPDCDTPGDGNCPLCHGKGKVLEDELSATTAFRYESPCSACHGSGECRTCGGLGEIEIGGESD